MAQTYKELKNIPLESINTTENRNSSNYTRDSIYNRHQTLSITDVISEGPIEGLVGGVAGIQLNQNPQAQIINEATGETTALVNAPDAINMENDLYFVSYNSSTNEITAKHREITGYDPEPARHIMNWEDYDRATDGGEYYAKITSVNKITNVGASVVKGQLILEAAKIPDHYVSQSALTAIDETFDYTKFKPVTIRHHQRGLDGSDEMVGVIQEGRIIKNSDDNYEWVPGVHSLQGFEERTPFWFSDKITHLDELRLNAVCKIKSITKTSDHTTTTKRHPQYDMVFDDVFAGNSLYDTGFENRHPWAFLGKLNRDVAFADVQGTGAGISKTSFQFRTGTAYQPPMASVGEAGHGSTARTNTAVKQQLEQSNSYDVVNGVDPTILVGSAQNGFNLSQEQIKAVDYVKLLINYPGGLHTVDEEDGDVESAAQRYRIGVAVKRPGQSNFTDYRYYTDDLELGYRVHIAHSKNAIAFEEQINLQPFRPFSDFKVSLERVDSSSGHGIPGWRPGLPDSEFSNISAATLASVTAIMQEKLTYPFTAYAKVDFPASAYPQLPIRHYDCKGIKVKVPSNYVTREESSSGEAEYTRDPSTGLRTALEQDWDGTFRDEPVYTDNPVWIYYDILTNNRYGLGDFLSEVDIDIYSLYRLSKYCDEEVDDLSGTGRTEPRYTMNVYITKSIEAYKIVKDMASNFISMLYFLDGKMTLVPDVPASPTYAFNRSNVIDGLFAYESTGSKTRANQCFVKWNNPSNRFRIESLLVEDTENIAKTGKHIPMEVHAYGCTSRSQAIRYARWKLYTALNQTELVSFETGAQGKFISPGDVITVQDSHRNATRYGGRISGKLTEGLSVCSTYAARAQIAADANGFTATERGQPTFMQGDIQLPTSVTQDRVIFEYGGTTAGTWIGVRKINSVDTFTFRAGDGAASVSATTAAGVFKNIPISEIPEFDGKIHTVSWEFDPANGTGKFWIDGRLVVDEVTTDGSAFTNSTWAGSNVGGWGQGYGGIAGNFAGTQWIDTIQSSLSVYANQTAFYPTKTSIPLDKAVTLESGSEYTLSVVTMEPGAYTQKDVTIDGVSYSAGDLITEAFIDTDGDGILTKCTIRTASAASSAYSANTFSSGNALLLTWKDSHRVETQNVTNTSGLTSKISVSSAFAVTPTDEAMWVLNETVSSVPTLSGGKEYKVLGVAETENHKYAITAGEYDIKKFDFVEDGSSTLAPSDPLQPIERSRTGVPKLRGLAVDLLTFVEKGGLINIYWTPPAGATRKVRQPDGSLQDIVVDEIYKDYNGVEIEHNLFGPTDVVRIPASQENAVIGPVPEGTFTVKVRVVRKDNAKSIPLIETIDVEKAENSTDVRRFANIQVGGTSDTAARLVDDNGTKYVELVNSNYTITGAGQRATDIINACTVETTYRQEISNSFPVTANRPDDASGRWHTEDHYVLLDASDTVDRLKLLKWHTDTGSGYFSTSSFQDVGTGTTTSFCSDLSGTMAKDAYSSTVKGSGTSFCSELSVGSSFKVPGTGVDNFVSARVSRIFSNTMLRLNYGTSEAFNGVTAYTDGFLEDVEKDVLIGRVYDTGSGPVFESFLALGSGTVASGISYESGSSIESLQPNQPGSDNSACQLNTGLVISKSSGGIVFQNSGGIRSDGKTSASSSSDGFFLGYDHNIGDYTFGVGDDTDFVRWNGTDLEITGKVTAKTGGQIGGWQITDTGIYGGDISSASAQALASGFVESLCASEGALVLHNQGSIHSKNFFINSDGSAKYRGSISAATGTFFGGLLPNAVDSDELNSGSVGSDQLATGSIDGQHISQSALLAVYETAAGGSVVQTSYAALDGQHEKFRIYAGDTSAASAPFRVTKGGQVVANNLQLYDSNDQLYFDSSTGGFTPSALAQIASALSARVFNFAEIWTGNLDSSDNSTFEEISLTESTNVTSKLRIPVNKLSATVSEEYFGLTNNAAFTTVDLNTDAGTAISLSDVNNPDSGSAIGRSLKAGEILRVSLLNVPTGVTLTGVSNATNPSTADGSFATSIEGPVDSTNVYFKMTAAGTFAATINIPGASAVTFSLTVVAKPDTLQAAKDKIPASITVKLDRNTASAAGTTVNVLANQTYTRVFDSTPGTTSYNVKTIQTDGIGYGFITSSVEVQLGQGAVDAQGYISRETTENSLAANSYYYNSTLSVSGGDSENAPSNRLFEVSVPTTSAGFVISGNAATQATQNTSVDTLDLTGNVTGSDGMTITPGTSSGTVVIDGNLTVNGTQTTTNTDSLQIADKCILVAANAANAAAVNSAGLYVDRSEFDTTNPSFAWQTSDSAFVASNKLKAAQFKSTGDGSQSSPAYIFGTRSNTGLYAEDASAGDRVVISTHDGSSHTTTTFDSLGITSGKDIIAPSGGKFKNLSSNWVAATDNDAYDFQFNNTSGTIVHIDAEKGNVGIGLTNADPTTKLYLRSATLTGRLAASLKADDLLIENSDDTGMTLYGAQTNSIAFADVGSSTAGLIRYTHADNKLDVRILDGKKFEIGEDDIIMRDDRKTGTGLSYGACSILDLFNTRTDLDHNQGSGLTFSTMGFETDSTKKVTRAGIRAGYAQSGMGYGFLDFQLYNSAGDDGTERVAPALNVWGDDNRGIRLGLGTSGASQPESLVHFKNTSNQSDSNTNAILTLDQDNGGANIGTKAGVLFQVGNGSARIDATKGAGSVVDLDFYGGAGTGTTSSAIHVDGSESKVGIWNTVPRAKLQVERLGIETSSTTEALTTDETVIASVNAGNFRTGKFMIQMEDIGNNNYLVAEMLFVYNSSAQSVNATEYGVVFTGNDKGVSFAVDYNNNIQQMQLKATCTNTSTNRRFTVARMALLKTT